MKVYLVYQKYVDFDDELQEELDKIFEDEVEAYNYVEEEYDNDDKFFRIEEWKVQ